MTDEPLTDARWWLTSTLANGESPRGVTPDEYGFIDGETIRMKAVAGVLVRAMDESAEPLSDPELADLLTVDEGDVAKAQVALDHVRAEVGC